MTNSLYQNIQALGNRIASNLETMGVSASFNDGGLTLADKILEIQSMANGVFLTSDKSIIQSGGTARLAAIAVKDGQLVNSDISILGADKSFSNAMTSNVNGFTTIRGDGFTVSSSGATLSSTGSTGSYVYCNTAINLQRTNSIIRFKCKESEGSGTAFCGQISYNDGASEYNTSMSIDTRWGASFFETTGTMPTGASVSDWLDVVIVITTTSQKVYINGELSVTASKDFSSQWDKDLYFTFFNSIGDFIVKDFSIDVGTVVATGSNGTANGSYTGSGAGKTNFIGVSGSVVSGTYTVIDGTFYDDGISGTASWDTVQTTVDRTSGQYTELSSSDNTKFQVKNITDSITIELDYYCTDTSEKGISIRQASTEVWSRTLTQLGVNANTWCHLKILLNNGEYQLFVDNVDKTPSSHTIGTFNKFFFRVTSDYRIRYKNFVVYPI